MILKKILNKFYEKQFFWYLFDSFVFGIVLGIIANHLHKIDLFNLNFIILSTLFRVTISAYQLNRFYKDRKIFNIFFYINSIYLLILFLYSNIFLNYKINLFSLLVIITLSYAISLTLYKLTSIKIFFKFFISYYLRIAVFFSGLLFDPLLLYDKYKLLFYLNPFYWFYLIFI